MEKSIIMKCRKGFFDANPALWFVLIYLALMAIVVLVFYDRFNFEGANLFTFLWTYIALLTAHTIVNWNRHAVFLKKRALKEIIKSYGHATYQYIPYLLIAVVYEHIFIYRNAFNDIFHSVDLKLMHLDELLFSVQPTIWMEKITFPAAVDYFMVAYALFLIYPYFYLVYLYQKNQLPVMHKAMLAQILSLFVALTMFITLPAKGPRYTFDPQNGTEFKGENLPAYSIPLKGVQSNLLENWTGKPSLFRLQYDFWNQIERIKTDCMPSMHTCLCLIVLIYAVRYRNIFKYKKFSMWFWIVGNVSLIFSTVYLRYHWVVDVIAGAALAIIMYYLTEYIYDYWLKKRAECGYGAPNVDWFSRVDKLQNQGADNS